MFKVGDKAMLGSIPVRIAEVTNDGTVALYVGPYPLSGVVETAKLQRA